MWMLYCYYNPVRSASTSWKESLLNFCFVSPFCFILGMESTCCFSFSVVFKIHSKKEEKYFLTYPGNMLDRRIHRRRPIRSKRSPPPLTNNRRAALLAPLIVVVVEATQNDADGSHRWSQLRPSSSSSFFSFPTASHRQQQQQLDNRKIRKLFTFLQHTIKMAPDVDKFPFKK